MHTHNHAQVKALNIPASENFDFSMFLADPKAVRDWNLQGLPSDSFSTENGVMVTRGTRWPLMIDPQVCVRLCVCTSSCMCVCVCGRCCLVMVTRGTRWPLMIDPQVCVCVCT